MGDPSSLLDAGIRPERHVQWMQVPAGGGLTRPGAGGSHSVLVSFPPAVSSGASSSPEHGVRSAVGGATLGGAR